MSPTSYQAAPPRDSADSRSTGPSQGLPTTTPANRFVPPPAQPDASPLPARIPAASKPRLIKPKLGPMRVVRRVARGLCPALAARPVAPEHHVRRGVGVLARAHHPFL